MEGPPSFLSPLPYEQPHVEALLLGLDSLSLSFPLARLKKRAMTLSRETTFNNNKATTWRRDYSIPHRNVTVIHRIHTAWPGHTGFKDATAVSGNGGEVGTQVRWVLRQPTTNTTAAKTRSSSPAHK